MSESSIPALASASAVSTAHNPHVWNERYRLARLDRDTLFQIGLFSGMVGFLFLMFHLLGNTTDVKAFSRSVLTWMVRRWSNDPSWGGNGNYTHGGLIPFVSIGLIWMKRREIYTAVKEPSNLGLVLVGLSLLLHYAGAKAQQSRVSLLALIFLLWSLPYAIYGWKVARHLIFPVAFLIYCIPLQFLDSATSHLAGIATHASAMTLNGIGIPVLVNGRDIIFLADQTQKLNVAEACSGLRSLLALSALSAIYGYLTMPTILKKWVLFLCAIPLAMIGNVARIVIVAIIARAVNYEFGTGLVHDWGGFFIFAVAIGLMVATGSLLNLDYKEIRRKWTTGATARS
jgi:exosortase